MSDLPNLPRTAAAIAVYDRLEGLFQTEVYGPTPLDDATVQAYEKALELLGCEVGAAYGEETKDRNNPKTCGEVIRPGPAVPPAGQELSFVRQRVAQWRARQDRT